MQHSVERRAVHFSPELAAPGTRLKAVREPENAYDKWAIKIYTQNRTPLGYIPAINDNGR